MELWHTITILGLLLIFLILIKKAINLITHNHKITYNKQNWSDYNKHYHKTKPYLRHTNEYLERNIKNYRKNEKGEVSYIPEQVTEQQPKIVGLTNPQGRWTQFVMQTKLGLLKDFLEKLFTNKDNSKGFWQIMVNAKDKEMGKNISMHASHKYKNRGSKGRRSR